MQTKHFNVRMQQRGIPSDIIKILRVFGYELEKEKVVLTAKNCKQIEEFLDQQIALLIKDKPCLWLSDASRPC